MEQIGTDTDCSGGRPVYYAWYEMYPKSLVVIPSSSVPVNPGDSFTARVTYQGSGDYLLTLTNNSTSPASTFSIVQNSTKTQNSSIEWVMEGPSNGSLTNFGSVDFTGASGTIGGTTAGVGSFSNAQSITMVTKRGIPRATPFGLTSAGFGVLWNHS